MKQLAILFILAAALVWTGCSKPDNQYDNNRAEAAETEGQKDKDNAETNEEAEADTAGRVGTQSANTQGRQVADEQFAMQAAEAGLAEVKFGKLAETQASSSEVKAFASMM